MSAANVIIIGGGIAGVSTAWFLAQRGERSITLIERESGLGTHATAQNAAILRTSMPDELTEGLARESARFLRGPPPGFSATPLIEECGVVIASTARETEDRPRWQHRLDARAERGEDGEPADVERLSPARLHELAPHFHGDVRSAWLLAREGRIDNAALMHAFASGARKLGVRFETDAAVRAIATGSSHAAATADADDAFARANNRSDRRTRAIGVELVDGRMLRAACVVIASGGWAERLGRDAGSRVRLRPTRRHLVITGADARVDARWPIVWIDGDPFYARPESGGLMVCACDEVDVDPDELAALPEERERALAKTARYLPGFADARAAHFWAGIRTLTHDDRFVIGRDPDVAGLCWVAGLGGHGMTCSAAVGRLAAELILDGTSAHPAANAVDPSRFADRRSARSSGRSARS
jgi:glycine/D-amino acid oxidase-like deaminating enzyme